MDEWLEAKEDVIEWSLNLKEGVECQAKTRTIEDEMFACSDEIVRLSGQNVGGSV